MVAVHALFPFACARRGASRLAAPFPGAARLGRARRWRSPPRPCATGPSPRSAALEHPDRRRARRRAGDGGPYRSCATRTTSRSCSRLSPCRWSTAPGSPRWSSRRQRRACSGCASAAEERALGDAWQQAFAGRPRFVPGGRRADADAEVLEIRRIAARELELPRPIEPTRGSRATSSSTRWRLTVARGRTGGPFPGAS